MLPPTTETHSTNERTAPAPSALQVRIGMEKAEYHVHELSESGFAITPGVPIGSGTTMHASFRLGAGLSISLQATAHSGQPGSDRQWFEFDAVDREVLDLLLMWSETSIVH